MSPTSSEKGSIITPLIVIVNWNSAVIWITTNNVNFSAKRHCWIIVNTKNEFKIERNNLYLIYIIYLLRIRVSGTTTPWISWNCKNFCFRWCYSTSCERLATVISQAKDTFMRIGGRLWWREIVSVKSEKKSSNLVDQQNYPLTCDKFCRIHMKNRGERIPHYLRQMYGMHRVGTKKMTKMDFHEMDFTTRPI